MSSFMHPEKIGFQKSAWRKLTSVVSPKPTSGTFRK